MGHPRKTDRRRPGQRRRLAGLEHSRSRPEISAAGLLHRSFTLITADGKLHSCSRSQNQELFSPGDWRYGLLGVVVHVTFGCSPHESRADRRGDCGEGPDPRCRPAAGDGFVYGDCQYSTDLDSVADRHAGVFSCYRPVPLDTPIPKAQKALGPQDWMELYTLARTDKKRAFERYSKYYLSTNGQSTGPTPSACRQFRSAPQSRR